MLGLQGAGALKTACLFLQAGEASRVSLESPCLSDFAPGLAAGYMGPLKTSCWLLQPWEAEGEPLAIPMLPSRERQLRLSCKVWGSAASAAFLVVAVSCKREGGEISPGRAQTLSRWGFSLKSPTIAMPPEPALIIIWMRHHQIIAGSWCKAGNNKPSLNFSCLENT